MEAKHTPGPWGLEAGFLVATAPNGVNFPIIQLFDPSREAGFCIGTREELEANACLMAAAPDLLAHLRFAVKLLKPWVGGTAQVEAMEAAIAKAEGK